jgi:hypothetical protein
MKTLLFTLSFFCYLSIFAQQSAPPPKNYLTRAVSIRKLITIDGKFDEPEWDNVEWETNFTQREPLSGKQPSQKTSFKLIYDQDFIYVAIKAYDSAPDSIGRRLTRRDDLDGDIVGIDIDSYNDKMTSFNFLTNAAGVKADGITTGDGDNEDYTPDPIWYVKTDIQSDGWTAEMKIPMSQLRFNSLSEQTWGTQVVRYLFRKEELSCWQHIPKEASGWVHHFGTLTGLKDLKPKRQIEIQPYLVAKTERFEREEGNPYMTGKSNNLTGGLDGKIGLTNDFTLDFTVNPDFGQVEADPSQVNLSAFETYYQEKRPFFIEGRNITSFQLMPGDGDMSANNLFYSRRIGRSPQYEPDLRDDEYEKRPENTNILFASKITGKTRNGLSLGIMESVTNSASSKIWYNTKDTSMMVEPLTNYFVGRVMKDFNKGVTQIGYIFTATNRKIATPELDFLHKSAYTAGIDFNHTWKNRLYYLNFKLYYSSVSGDTAAILNTQTSSARYFQRPNCDYLTLDSSLTNLRGLGGVFQIGKGGNGKISYVGIVSFRSPSLELNDLGYMPSADQVMQIFWLGYRIWTPFSIFRNFRLNFNQWTGLDFGGNYNYAGGNVNLNAQLKNYWYISAGANMEGNGLSNDALRGGPSVKTAGGYNYWAYLGSDEKKKFKASIEISQYFGNFGDANSKYVGMSASYRPNNAISFSISPAFSARHRKFQYIDTKSFENNDRYLFGKMDQKELSMAIRANLNISTDLTVQFYCQPYISSGKFSEYKYITNPLADKYADRFRVIPTSQIFVDENNDINVDENNDKKTDYSFDIGSYNWRSYRSNLVIRWEYTPGSVVYLVWSQNRSNDLYDKGSFQTGREFDRMFDNKAHNVFLVKFAYRFKL